MNFPVVGKRIVQSLLVTLAALLLCAGCGGGGGGASAPTPAARNQPPTPAFSRSPDTGEAPRAVTLDGSASRDVDGSITGYAWDLGDGSTATGITTQHTYRSAGNFTITLTVTDAAGASVSLNRQIVVAATTQAAPSGTVSLGPVVSAPVSVHNAGDEPLAQTTTDTSGTYPSTRIPADYDGPLIIRVTADPAGATEYVCDLPSGCRSNAGITPFGSRLPLPEEVRLQAITPGIDAFAHINPFTTLAAERALAASGGTPTPETAAAALAEVEEALEALLRHLLPTDLCVLEADGTTPAA